MYPTVMNGGGLRDQLTDRIFDVIALHIRPNAAFPADWSSDRKLQGKHGDIAKALTLVRTGVPTIFVGDFNTGTAVKIVEGAGKGLKLISKDQKDTDHAPGDQRLDQLYATPDFITRGISLVKSTISDHDALLWNGTLPKSTT